MTTSTDKIHEGCYMFKKIMSQAIIDTVTLEEAKAQCRLTGSFTMDDAYITSLIETCNELAQNYTKRLLSVGNVITTFGTYQDRSFLFGGEIEEVKQVFATNLSGVEEELTLYSFNPVSQILTLSPLYASYTDFMVSYDCGYSVVPKPVKQGILLMLASMYNNREDGLIGQDYTSLPMTSLKLLDAVKL